MAPGYKRSDRQVTFSFNLCPDPPNSLCSFDLTLNIGRKKQQRNGYKKDGGICNGFTLAVYKKLCERTVFDLCLVQPPGDRHA